LPAPELIITPEVERELDFILDRQGGFIWEALDRRSNVYPVVAQIFHDEGIPHDLINLALIESGFSTKARSRAGAVGMWQFMRPTARQYGLRVDRKEDQRQDVVLSTIAAARHLLDLYTEYGCWYLALAAYNAGTGTVNRAIMRAGSSDYWTILRKGRIPRETMRYVPRFIASTLIVKHLGSGSDYDRVRFAQLVAAGSGGAAEVDLRHAEDRRVLAERTVG
jgi:membrane-bound lytic murein transglycosylase D